MDGRHVITHLMEHGCLPVMVTTWVHIVLWKVFQIAESSLSILSYYFNRLCKLHYVSEYNSYCIFMCWVCSNIYRHVLQRAM